MHDREAVGSKTPYLSEIDPRTVYPPLRGHEEMEVVIVGGGLTGLSAALHLAESGVSCAVLEARQPGWGASGRNGGQLNRGLKYNPDVIETMFGKERGRRLVEIAWGNSDFTFSLIRRLGIECDARQNGSIRAVTHANTVCTLKQTVENWNRYGFDVRFLDEQAVAASTGTTRYKAAMFDPRGGDLNPLKLSLGLAVAAVAAGAAVYGDSAVSTLERTGGGWVVKTAQGSVSAKRVLLATNGYTDDLWSGLRRSVIPVFSAIAATEPLTDELAAEIMPTRSVLYESGNITVYYRMDAQQRLLIGGRGPMRPIHEAGLLPNLTGYATRLWPALKEAKWNSAWNGRIAMTRDHLPHFHNPAEGLFAYLGYNGRGVALGTALGPHLARQLQGGAVDEFPLPVTTISPIAFHDVWPIGAKVAIWHGRIKDRLGL